MTTPRHVCKVLSVAKATELPVQVFRDQLADHLERVVHRGERFIVTRNNKARAALVSLEDLARLEQLDLGAKPAKRRPQ